MGRKTHRTLVEDTYKVSVWQLRECIDGKNIIKKMWKDGFVTYFQYEDLGSDFEGVRAENLRIVYKYGESAGETRVSLTTSKCNFGGKRYWFKCPHCNIRAGTLYKTNGYFACRSCHNLTYHSNNVSRKHKLYLYQKMILKRRKALKLLKHKQFYANKPTKFKKYADRLLTSIYFDI